MVTDPDGPETRWRGRPIAGNAVRALAVSVPLASSIVGGVVLSHLIHRPHGGLAIVGWWLAIMAMSTVILVAVDRVARRMLPLATLLKLSMAFPDQAPSRFKVAARAGTTRSLEQQLRRAEEEGIEDGPAQAARRILMLVGALGAHDRRTRGHSERVRAFNDLIAAEMRLPQSDRDRLRWAALLHDIGKLHVPTRILNKPKKPTEKEWAILKSHPARGARIASPLAGWLGEWAPTIEQHHERWDGAGYPNGLAGNDICLGARIVAVADAYEVMTAPRPYSRPVSAAAAREELARCADSQFDPEIVRAFLNISIGKLRKVVGPISWLAQLPLVGATPRLEAAVGLAGRQAVSVAATATGTGVLAAAMLPQAATPGHHHHHHPHITRLSTVDSSAGQAPAASAGVDNSQRKAPSPTATDAPRASGKAHEQAAAGPASHPDGVASAGSGASTGTSGSTTSSRSDSGQAPAARPTTPSGGGQSAAPAPTSGSSGSGSSGGTSGGSHDPQPAPAPDQSSSPSDSGGSSGSGSNDPAPAPSPSQTSTGDPQPSHGNDGGHGHQ